MTPARKARPAAAARRKPAADGAPRITGRSVPPLVPARGPVYVMLIGEAPGPNGADKSGIPFFGDAAGAHLYQALASIGAMTLPPAIADLPWDGQIFADAELEPSPHGVALGNAYDRCPTDDGHKFRAPSRAELQGPENVTRIAGELVALQARGLRGVVTMGRVSTKLVDFVIAHASDAPTLGALQLAAVPHPSALGLLSMGKDRPKGTTMRELQAMWMERCIDAVQRVGYERV